MELNAHIPRGREKTKLAPCAETLVIGSAEEVAGFLIGTLNYLAEDFLLLVAVGGSLCCCG